MDPDSTPSASIPASPSTTCKMVIVCLAPVALLLGLLLLYVVPTWAVDRRKKLERDAYR